MATLRAAARFMTAGAARAVHAVSALLQLKQSSKPSENLKRPSCLSKFLDFNEESWVAVIDFSGRCAHRLQECYSSSRQCFFLLLPRMQSEERDECG